MKECIKPLLFMICMVFLSGSNAIHAISPERVADYSSPQKTYLTYLYAVKNNELELAKQCWFLPGESAASILDILVGIWVTHHHFNEVVALKFHERGRKFIRPDCTDRAIDRTIERVTGSQAVISGNRAELMILWQENDGYPDAVFHYTPDEPIIFQRINSEWKIDAHEMAGLDQESIQSVFSPGSMGALMRNTKLILEALIEDLQEDRITTPEGLEKAWEQKAIELMKQHQSLHE
jgi:hypothetical protein